MGTVLFDTLCEENVSKRTVLTGALCEEKRDKGEKKWEEVQENTVYQDICMLLKEESEQSNEGGDLPGVCIPMEQLR